MVEVGSTAPVQPPKLKTAQPPEITTDGAQAWHVLTGEGVAQEFEVEPARGLTGAEAEERLAKYGPNRFAEAEVEPRWHAFVRQYEDPMQVVLLVAGAISIYPVKQLGTGLVILALTVLNAVLGLSQEGKAAAAVAALAKMMIVKARVRRDGVLTQLPAEQLVPGDIVAIEAGDVVPADGRLLAAATLEVAEAALTGESLPVGKSLDPVEAVDAPLGDRTDMVYMNTNVTRGTGEFVVTATGMATEVGHISGMLQTQEESKSPLTVAAGEADQAAGHDRGARAGRFDRDQHVARAELHRSVHRRSGLCDRGDPHRTAGGRHDDPCAWHPLLAEAEAIVKRLRSTETLGATSAICSDKTGTLTLNQMTAVELTIPGRRYTISGTGYGSEGQIKHVYGEPEVDLEQFMLPLALACDAVVTR